MMPAPPQARLPTARSPNAGSPDARLPRAPLPRVLPHCALLSILLAACGAGAGSAPALLQSPDGKWRVIHRAEAAWKEDRARQEAESAFERLPDVDLVYAHNDDMAHGAWVAARQKGREAVLFVGIDALPAVGRAYLGQGQLDATVAYPTCAEAAIDLALLLCEGVAIAPQTDFELGTRLWTRANHAEGGRQFGAEGDGALAALRLQHGELLTTTPATDHVFRVGMAQCTDDEPWRQAMREDLVAAAARYPQVEFDYRAADDDTEKQRSIVRDFVNQGYHAILVSPKETLTLAAPCREAMAKGIHVIVIDRRLGTDDYSVFVGGDNVQIGRVAGRAIRELLPDGGTIVELMGLMTSSPAQERHRGFVEELGLVAPE